LNHAVDRERFNEVVMAGLGEVAWQPFPEGSLAHNPEVDEQYPYDPERARELLAEAGVPDGFEFDMVTPGGVSGQERQAEFLQEQLAEVGITANLIPSTEIANEYYLQKTGDAFSAARPAGAGPTNQLFDQWGNFQFVAIHNLAERDDITELVKEARQATTPEDMQGPLQEASAIVVEEALEVPLALQPRNVAWDTERIEGSIEAPADICDPFDLQGARLR
jgi:peptide/nickel transport system substrate-binding protein